MTIGVLTQAQKASTKTNEKSAIEEVELAYASLYAEYLEKMGENVNEDKYEHINRIGFVKELTGIGSVGEDYAKSDAGIITFTYSSNGKNADYLMTIDTSGKVSAEMVTGASTYYGTKVITGITTVKVGENPVEIGDNWQLFYADNDYAYLIYGGGTEANNQLYYPRAAVDMTKGTNIISGEGTYYTVKCSSGERDNLINFLKTPENWTQISDEFNKDGTFGENAGVKAVGAPNIEMWFASWNAKYPSETIECKKYESGATEYQRATATTKTAVTTSGYMVRLESETITAEGESNGQKYWSYSKSLSSKTGYSNTLYYPIQSNKDNCYGYWLAAPSAGGANYVCLVYCYGSLNYYNYYRSNCGVRPVVSIPKSAFQGNSNTSSLATNIWGNASGT